MEPFGVAFAGVGMVSELYHRALSMLPEAALVDLFESIRYRDFMGWDVPWYSAQDSADALLAGRGFGLLVCYLRHGDRVFETYWTTGRGNEPMAPTYGLLDMTVYGRQETWEDSPAGWPQRWGSAGGQFRTDGRPTAQWSRLAAGRSDDLGTKTTAPNGWPNQP